MKRSSTKLPPTKNSCARTRRGVALFAALVLTTLLALMLAGTLASMHLAQRSLQLSSADARLSAAADFALTALLTDSMTRTLADLPLGEARSFDVDLLPDDPNLSASVSATRLPRNTLWLVAQAVLRGRDLGQRRANLIVRWQTLMFSPVAPILSRGAVRLRSSVMFVRDTVGDADCRSIPLADVVTPTSGLLTSDDSATAAIDARANDSTSYLLAEWQRSAIDHAPGVVHVTGDTTIASGAFDGILIVDGSLVVNGSFIVSGLVIARTIIVRGALELRGSLLSFASSSDALFSIDLTNTNVRFDPCMVQRVLRHAAVLRTVNERSWSEVF